MYNRQECIGQFQITEEKINLQNGRNITWEESIPQTTRQLLVKKKNEEKWVVQFSPKETLARIGDMATQTP